MSRAAARSSGNVGQGAMMTCTIKCESPNGAAVLLPAGKNTQAAAAAAYELAGMMRGGCVITLEDHHGRVYRLDVDNLPDYAEFMNEVK